MAGEPLVLTTASQLNTTRLGRRRFWGGDNPAGEPPPPHPGAR